MIWYGCLDCQERFPGYQCVEGCPCCGGYRLAVEDDSKLDFYAIAA